jgi:hypothetical protein
MGNFATMIMVLGGTFLIAGALLYYSLLPGSPRTGSSKRRAAVDRQRSWRLPATATRSARPISGICAGDRVHSGTSGN